MQRPASNLFTYTTFRKKLQNLHEPILIQDSEHKAFTPRGHKPFSYHPDHLDQQSRVSRSLKYVPFIRKNPNHTLQPEETLSSFIFHQSTRTVEKIYNSKPKNPTRFPSMHSFHKFDRFTHKQTTPTKNWPAQVKCTTFNNFFQTKKPQIQNKQSTLSFTKNLKLQKYKPQADRQRFQSLRETQDTLPEGINLVKSNGPKIEHFELVKLLGKGKNGEVYLALHKKSGFACGLKIIKKKNLHRGSVEQRKKTQDQLLNEIKIQLYLRHPNLIELYGVFCDSQNIYLIQQLGVNGQLYELMKKRVKFSQQTTALLASDIINGIEAMHNKKVIHRDLKPQNMVLIYGVCKICDFGWSIYSDPNDTRSTLCGTLLYLSPEMLTGKNYNEKIDIWAYGTLVYELFTGENPFKIKDKSDLNRVVTNDLVMGDDTPHQLKDFMFCILNKHIQFRPSAAEIKRHKWLQKYLDLETSQELAKL